MTNAVRAGLTSAIVIAVMGAAAFWQLGYFDWRLAMLVVGGIAFSGYSAYRRQRLSEKYPGLKGPRLR